MNAAPDLGACLKCYRRDVSTNPGTVVLVPHYLPDAPQTVCPGSGFPTARGDGKDAVRRIAIGPAAEANQLLRGARSQLATAITPGSSWSAIGAVGHFAENIAAAEMFATLWHHLVISGDWWRVWKEAHLNTQASPENSLDGALERASARGAEDWVRAARRHLMELVDPDGTADSPLVVFFLELLLMG